MIKGDLKLQFGSTSAVSVQYKNLRLYRSTLVSFFSRFSIFNLHLIFLGLQKVKRNQASVSSTLDQCEAAETMGSEMVEQALKNCQHLADDLSEQWQEIMMLRQVLHTLPMRLRLSVSPIKVEREISQLQEVHTVLEERCANLTFLLRNRLSLWRRFERQLELVQQNVQETDYMMELLTIQGSIDYDRLQRATERLEVR